MVAEEISVNGEKYVLSRIAARLTKYSNDYIGELCRSGKITAKQVGKLWYIEKNSLLAHQKENGKQGFGAKKIIEAKKLARLKVIDLPTVSRAPQEEINPFLPPLKKKEKTGISQIQVSPPENKFISSRAASRLTKYSNDYIGELCRSGKIISKRIGKFWYIEKNSLLAYQKENGKQGFGAKKIIEANKFFAEKIKSGLVSAPPAAKKIIPTFRFRDFEPKAIALVVALLVPLASYFFVSGGMPAPEKLSGRDPVSEVAKSKFAAALTASKAVAQAGITLSSAYDGFTGLFRKAGDSLSALLFGDLLPPPTIIVRQDESRETKEKVAVLEIELEKLKKERGTTVTGTVSTERVIERVERVVEKSAVTPKDLEILSNALRSEMYRLTSQTGPTASANFVAIAPSNRIDNLSNVAVSGANITSSSFAGSVSGTTGSFETFSVSGLTTLSDITMGNATSSSLSVSNNVSIGGSAAITGNGSILGRLSVATTSTSGTITLTQSANGVTGIRAYRATDLAPTGDFISYSTADQVTDLFRVDNSGNIFAGGIFNSGSVTITSASVPQLRVQFNPANEWTATTNSTGSTTFAFNGASSSLAFVPQNDSLDTFSFRNSANASILSVDTANQRVGVGITTPTNKLSVGVDLGAGTNVPTTAITVGNSGGTSGFSAGSGIQNNISFLWDDATGKAHLSMRRGGSPFSNFMTFNDGNVGIGTTTPVYKLDVSNVGSLVGRFLNSQTGANSDLVLGNGNNTWIQRVTGDGTYDYTLINAGNGVRVLTALYNGNVGIGTTSPLSKLAVSGGASIGANYNIAAPTNGLIVEGNVGIGTTNITDKLFTAMSSSNTSTLGSGGISIQNSNNTGGNRATLSFANSAGFTVAGIEGILTHSAQTGSVAISVVNAGSPAEVARFTNTGHVGIGTTSPPTTLSVGGSGYITGGLGIGSFTSTTGLLVSNAVPTGGAMTTQGVGLGMESLFAATELYGSNGALIDMSGTSGRDYDFRQIFIPSANSLSFSASSTDNILTMTGTGNVGIGTASPADLLHLATNSSQGVIVERNTNDSSHPYIILRKSKGTITSPTDVSDGTGLGQIAPLGYFNGDWRQAVMFGAEVDGSPSGTAVPGRIVLKTSDTAGTLTERMRITSAGNVGIGTTSPSEILTVNGAPSSGTFLRLASSAASPRMWDFQIAAATGLFSIADQTAAVTRFAINSSGNVGIGTTSPGSLLDVSSAGNTEVRLTSTVTTGSPQLSFYEGLTLKAAIQHRGSGASVPNMFALVSINDFRILTGGTGESQERLRITSTGNVGIGTTSPGALLDVSSGAQTGTIRLGGDVDAITRTNATRKLARIVGVHYTNSEEPISMLVLDAETTTSSISIGGGQAALNSATRINFITAADTTTLSGTNRMTIDSTGNVGIGTTTPGAKLVVEGGDIQISTSTANHAFRIRADVTTLLYIDHDGSNSYFSNERAGKLFLRTNALERLTIDSTGNVGIGTASPTALLDVNAAGASTDILRVRAGGAGISIGTNASGFGLIGNTAFGSVITIDTSGNVGIGTTEPVGKLQVIKDSGSGTLSTDATSAILIKSATNAMGLRFGVDEVNKVAHIQSVENLVEAKALTLNAGGGNVGIGTTTPVSTLSVQGSLCVRNTGSCGTTAGTIYANNTAIQGIDLAETYPTKDTTLVAGEIVGIDFSNPEFVVRATSTSVVLGIVSTKPGILLGGFDDVNFASERKVPLALSGRVPVKVSTENGPIKRGDKLSVSSVPGVAMKSSATSTQTIGIALYDFDGTIDNPYLYKSDEGPTFVEGRTFAVGSVIAFINLSWSKVDTTLSSATSTSAAVAWAVDYSSGTTTVSFFGNLNLNGNAIINVSRIASAGGAWGIDETGRIFANKIETKDLKVENGITTIDKTTGTPYCVYVSGGLVVSESGDCLSLTASSGGALSLPPPPSPSVSAPDSSVTTTATNTPTTDTAVTTTTTTATTTDSTATTDTSTTTPVVSDASITTTPAI